MSVTTSAPVSSVLNSTTHVKQIRFNDQLDVVWVKSIITGQVSLARDTFQQEFKEAGKVFISNAPVASLVWVLPIWTMLNERFRTVIADHLIST